LSDGQQTVPGDPIAQATEAKAAGIQIVAYVFGQAQTNTLTQIASFTEDYTYQPSQAR
jgi:hypothetical protein